MSIPIQLATTADELAAVFRFRYRVYVEEMRRVQKYANHSERIVEEPLDGHGSILFAADQGVVVGTVRVNLGCRGGFDYYEDLYQMQRFGPFFPKRMSITTKLMVAPEYRQTLVPLQLATGCFRLAMEAGVRFDIIDCNPPLKGFFEKLGYRQIFPDIAHPEYGTVVPMVIVCLDLPNLDRVRSPFRKYAKKVQDDTNSVAFFYSDLCSSGEP